MKKASMWYTMMMAASWRSIIEHMKNHLKRILIIIFPSALLVFSGCYNKPHTQKEVVMSSELYEKFAYINKVDQAIEEAEREVSEGAKPVSVKEARKKLEKITGKCEGSNGQNLGCN